MGYAFYVILVAGNLLQNLYPLGETNRFFCPITIWTFCEMCPRRKLIYHTNNFLLNYFNKNIIIIQVIGYKM